MSKYYSTNRHKRATYFAFGVQIIVGVAVLLLSPRVALTIAILAVGVLAVLITLLDKTDDQ